jgi:hypothetical protein
MQLVLTYESGSWVIPLVSQKQEAALQRALLTGAVIWVYGVNFKISENLICDLPIRGEG